MRSGPFFSAVGHALAGLVRAAGWLLSQAMIGMVRIYQIFLSPLLGRNCRYTPTCSQYFILAVKKYGPLQGGVKGICRVLRCHPFHEGGEDWP